MRKRQITVGLVCLAANFVAAPLAPAQVSPSTLTKAREVLRAGLKSKEFWPSMHAAEAMTIAGMQGEVVAHVKPLLGEETDDQRRCGLARELVRAGQVEYAEEMLDILRADDSHGHVHAAESLFKVGWDGDSTPLRQTLVESDNIIMRLMAAGALAKHGSVADREQALSFLREVLRTSDDANEFRIAAWVLARTGERDDIPQIRLRLADTTDERFRAFLHHAMAALGDEIGREELRKNLVSENPALRTYAATFAGDAGMIGAIPDLIRMLDDESLDARIRAAQSIFALRKLSLNDFL